MDAWGVPPVMVDKATERTNALGEGEGGPGWLGVVGKKV